MSAHTNREKCPLCLEEMDSTDKELKPCKCGYEICLWCWHHIMEMDHKDESGGRCPGCRSIYNKDRIMGTSGSNNILKGLYADKSNLQKEQNKSHKPKSSNVQFTLAEEPKGLNNVRVIQRKLVYIVGMPSEFAYPKVLKQKNFLGQYGKIENIVIDNIGANQQSPGSGRVYVTFSREEEAAQCIQVVNGYILDGRPLKATFGVTRYCHVWLSNRTCWKENCSYVHYKAAAEDICSRDDVSVFCARIHHLMGMDTKGFQYRSGSTLPPPVHCNSRATICSEILKDICTNDDRLLPSGAAKKLDLLPATTPWDLSLSSGSQKEHINEQLTSNNDKSQATVQLGNDTSNSKQTISAENQTSDISLQKPQYASVVSQRQGGSSWRFTVLTRQGASTDTGPKATGQVVNGTSNSTKFTLIKNECRDSITILRSENMNLLSQKPEHSSHLWVSKSVQSHAQAEKKNENSDISAKLVPGNQKRLSENTVSNSSTAVYTTSGRPMLSNLSTSDAKSQLSARPHNVSRSNGKLASQNQLQLVKQSSAPVSNTEIARASLGRNILNNQVSSADSKHQNSAQGGPHCLYNMEITRSDHCSDSIQLSKPLSAVSSTDMVAPNGKGRKKQVCCPPGFEKLQNSSDSGRFVPLSSTVCSEPCSTTDTPVEEYCGITDQPHIISMVSHCLDDGDVTQNRTGNISSPLVSTDTIWRRAQFPSTYYSSLSNHTQVSLYSSGFLQCVPPPVSCPSYQQPSYLDGTTGRYMSTGVYDSFHLGTASGMTAGMVGTLLQQPPMPSPPHGWTHGNEDSGLKWPQVDISYPKGYTLF